MAIKHTSTNKKRWPLGSGSCCLPSTVGSFAAKTTEFNMVLLFLRSSDKSHFPHFKFTSSSLLSVCGSSNERSGFKLTEELVHCAVWAAESVFDQSVDVMLSSMFTSGYFKYVGYAQQCFQCVPVSHHL